MFCDVVDSTKLSSQLDPEDYREVVRAYQSACSDVIQRYDGHIAQYLGDGLLVYFGYPVAHEEDAQRAIHTGLGILEAIRTLNTRLEQTKGMKLAVRLGIHTGLVVVGEIGGEGRQEQLALGDVPNIAARIQGLADPNTVVISADTYRLVEGYFDCRSVGEQMLRGISRPISVYQVLQESGVQSRLDVASTRGLTPLVGRESEVTLLLERWEQAKEGQGQVILLSGEAGIGKSRLVQVLKDHVAAEPHRRWECRSSPYYQNTALYPIIDLIQRTLRWQQDDTPDERLANLERQLRQYRLPLEETIPLFAPLLSLSIPDDRYPPLHLSPQRQRQKTLESIVAILLELAEQQPVLFILEDLHWTDPTTLEFLGLLIDQTPTASLYLLLTCRPEFQPAWSHRSYLTEGTVHRLSREQIARVAAYVAGGKKLPEQVLEQIVEKTDGVPLFIEELTKAVLESGVLQDVDGQYTLTGPLASFTIPATLQDSLMARLDRLVTAKAVAQYAAVIGRQFAYDVLLMVSQLDAATLQRELGRLVEVEIVYQRGLPPQAYYVFKHALIRDAAYESLLKSTRQHYHQCIAQVLETQFPETAENQPELLAHHYTEAGLHEHAVPAWQRAGERAVARSAYAEAIGHFTTGLKVLQGLPETPARHRQELGLQTSLGLAQIAMEGYASPNVERTYRRAYILAEHVADRRQRFAVLYGLCRLNMVRPAYRTALELGDELLRLAEQQNDAAERMMAHYGLGVSCYSIGEFSRARSHQEQSLASYDVQHRPALLALYGGDPGVMCLGFLALTLWSLGYAEQALARLYEAQALAQEVAHPLTRANNLFHTAWFHLLRREATAAREAAEASAALSQDQGFALVLALATHCRGAALALQGQLDEGMAQMQQGLEAFRATGAEMHLTWHLSNLAWTYGQTGQVEAGWSVLGQALTLADEREEHFVRAWLYCLQGTLLLQRQPVDASQAESCFQQAISIAQSQHAKSWELRAATSLARLWQQQGKRQDAYDVLAPVYGWFTEGFDTADLQEAKALLDDLS
jgi:predicted ATPase/class 3 adenylate cyclase